MDDYGRLIEPGTLRMERLLPAPIERVWRYLVEPEKRARWLAGGTMGAAAGDSFELHFENAKLGGTPPERYRDYDRLHVQTSRVIRIEAPRLLVISWSHGERDASEVSFELTPRDAQTHLRLTHRLLATRSDTLSVSGGWHTHLDLLGDLLAGRTPRPFWTTLQTVEAAYDQRIPA